MTLTQSAPLTRRTNSRLPGAWLVVVFMLELTALVLLATTPRSLAAAQQGDPSAAGWQDALGVAPVPPGESPIFNFFSVILVPPSSPNQFSSAAIDSAGSSNDGSSYDIMLALPNGRAELRGTLGRTDYDEIMTSAPPGCSTATGRARGYCFRTTPPYEYFPGLSVAGSPAIALYGGFETNFGATVSLTWYDADADVSYSLMIYGSNGAVAQAGFSGQDAAAHVRPARDLAALAAQFTGI